MGYSSWARKELGMTEQLNNDNSLFTPPPAAGTHPILPSVSESDYSKYLI